jgi:hypothetical protein
LPHVGGRGLLSAGSEGCPSPDRLLLPLRAALSALPQEKPILRRFISLSSALIPRLKTGDFPPTEVKCPHCGLEYNADFNAAINIAKLSLAYMVGDGGGLTHPSTPREVMPPACGFDGGMVKSGESSHFSGRSVNKDMA